MRSGWPASSRGSSRGSSRAAPRSLAFAASSSLPGRPSRFAPLLRRRLSAAAPRARAGRQVCGGAGAPEETGPLRPWPRHPEWLLPRSPSGRSVAARALPTAHSPRHDPATFPTRSAGRARALGAVAAGPAAPSRSLRVPSRSSPLSTPPRCDFSACDLQAATRNSICLLNQVSRSPNRVPLKEPYPQACALRLSVSLPGALLSSSPSDADPRQERGGPPPLHSCPASWSRAVPT